MSREVHVRFWESAAVQPRRATHLIISRSAARLVFRMVWIFRRASEGLKINRIGRGSNPTLSASSVRPCQWYGTKHDKSVS